MQRFPKDYTPGSPPEPGALLRTFIEEKGSTQAQLSKSLGGENVRYWIKSGGIPPNRIDDIGRNLGLSSDQKQTLLLARLPALDSVWLERNVEERNRAGKLLEAYRERAGLSQDTLAKKIDFSRATLGKWENGESPLRDLEHSGRAAFNQPDKSRRIRRQPTDRLKKLFPLCALHLKLSAEEQQYFLHRIIESNDARGMRAESTHLGRVEERLPFEPAHDESLPLDSLGGHERGGRS